MYNYLRAWICFSLLRNYSRQPYEHWSNNSLISIVRQVIAKICSTLVLLVLPFINAWNRRPLKRRDESNSTNIL